MGLKRTWIGVFILGFVITLFACNKETVLVPDNTSPPYDQIPSLLLENYVNRLFIDLIGREPLDNEMIEEVAVLKNSNASIETRIDLINRLQSDTTFIAGDTSYQRAYYHWFYESAKGRVLEGASDAEIEEILGPLYQSLTAILAEPVFNQEAYNQVLANIQRLEDVLDSEMDYLEDSIEVSDVFRLMVSCQVYDEINMNTFNFVNATFDNLFYRNPTTSELNNGMAMVDGMNATIMGESGVGKTSYINILIGSREFYEGVVIWAYQRLLARNPNTDETLELIDDFYTTKNFQEVQKAIMISDEYANF